MNSEKIWPYTVSWSGPCQRACTINDGCVGPGNARQQL